MPKLNPKPEPPKFTFDPCPYCGSTRVGPTGSSDVWFVQCDDCQSTGPCVDSERAAVNQWNIRKQYADALKALELGKEWLEDSPNAFDALYDYLEKYWKKELKPVQKQK